MTMTIFNRTPDPKPELNLEQADRILENIFAATNTEPNLIPLEVLTSYSNYRRERFSLQKTIILIIMVLFLMLPLLFVPSEFSIRADDDAAAVNPTYTLKITTPMPVQRVHASIDGRSVPVYEIAARTYSIEPAVNGTMTVTVTLINHQTATQEIEVANVDFEAPVLVSSDLDKEHVYLYLSDVGTGIAYGRIEAATTTGLRVVPVSYDEKTGCVVFSYPKDSLNIYIPDLAGNSLHLVLTLK